MELFVVFTLIVLGYFVGSISFTRNIGRFVLPDEDLEITNMQLPHAPDIEFTWKSVSATTLRFRAGPQYGMLASLLDMMKAIIPIIITRLYYSSIEYSLLVSLAVVLGHNFPIYYNFKGGRGVSSLWGSMLILNWKTIPLMFIASMFFGLVIFDDSFLTYLLSPIYLIFWAFVFKGVGPWLYYSIFINVMYFVALRPEISEYIRFRKTDDYDKAREIRRGQTKDLIDKILAKRKQLRWILLIVFSISTGYLIVQYLVQVFSNLALYSVLLTLTSLLSLTVFIIEFKNREKNAAFLLAIVCLVIGFSFANMVFLNQTDEYILPLITRTDGGDGHTAVLYFTHGEPPGYDPGPWRATMQEFDHDKVPFVPWHFKPFFFNSLRNQYLLAGGSPHNKLHYSFVDNLRRAMPEEESKGTRFYLGFLDSHPHPDEITVQAINEGASKIIILPVFVTESTHTIAGTELIESVEPEKYGIQVLYTGSLGNSDSLQNVFVDRAERLSFDYKKIDVGVLLVGHGQPDEWEDLYPEQNRQESEYRQGIKDKLVSQGFLDKNVIKCWMSFQNPTITESALELLEQDVKVMLVFSVSLSAEAIHSERDVPEAIEAAELPEEIEIKYIGQYGDHPLAIQAMVEKINSVR